jgi:hypothetical protein
MTLDSLCAIVGDPQISYSIKKELVYGNNFCEQERRTEQLNAVNALLSESKRNNDNDGIMLGYTFLAYLYDEWNNPAAVQTYLDSAEICLLGATNTLAFARYHYLKGKSAIDSPYGRKKVHKEFDSALNLYIESDYSIKYLSYILYNITLYAIHQPDTIFTQGLIDKVNIIKEKQNTMFLEITVYALKSSLYKTYYTFSPAENLLDSAINYDLKVVNLFYSNQYEFNPVHESAIMRIYVQIAELCALKEQPDMAMIDSCLSKAADIGYDDDNFTGSRVDYINALLHFHNKNYHEAEMLIRNAEKLLEANIRRGNEPYPRESFYRYETKLYDLHSRILAENKQFKASYEYNLLKNNLKTKIQNIETNELEQLYNTDSEEFQIERLKSMNAAQFKLTSLLIIIAILLVITISLLWLWFYAFNNNNRRRSALIRAEKQESELTLKIKEEQAAKAELEKYEVLSEYRLKELELADKNMVIKQLKSDKEELDRQIESYADKINDYIKNIDKRKAEAKNDVHLRDTIIADLERLISRKLPDRKLYLDLLPTFDNDSLTALKNSYDGHISVPYIKYCICLSLGMDVSEMSECFSIEVSSVHMIRYRLKKKLGLSANENLEVFLRQLNRSLSNCYRDI